MVVSGGANWYGLSMKCWCRWRWDHMSCQKLSSLFSSGFLLAFGCLTAFGLIGVMYSCMVLNKAPLGLWNNVDLKSLGCQEDNEGSWSIGVFYGDSPFSLKPIEDMNVWKSERAAWPVANPVITCATTSNSNFPSNFVADPFLYVQGDVLFAFFETKNTITNQGDIGIAKSIDKGATWQYLGIALDEDWHLSYPYVFSYLGQIYMLPESSERRQLCLYRAVDFPLQWKMEKIIMRKPLVDAVMINHDGLFWLLGSDHARLGTKNGQLSIWYSKSPLGPFMPHIRNPIYNVHRGKGARNGGRPFLYHGNLYRVGQDCSGAYGRRLRLFKITILTVHDYKETEVSLGFQPSRKGRNTWNGARYHHLDAQKLSSGEWVAVMDGDRSLSGDPGRRFFTGFASLACVLLITGFFCFPLSMMKCSILCTFLSPSSGKRSSPMSSGEKLSISSSNRRRISSLLNRLPLSLHGKISPNSCARKLVLAGLFVLGIMLTCIGVSCIYGGNGVEEAYPVNGSYSQFTLLTMTHDARMWNLKMYVKHYSRCSSVKEIVVVWNKGKPPRPSDFDTAVPIRIRLEDRNSLNNRFKTDPLITTRAVLELDDDIMMKCDDIERGFRAWRHHPDRIVGFYPRLIGGKSPGYHNERYARTHGGYNMILTGAAFVDGSLAFERYWSDKARPGRELVDEYFNCEDILLNYLYANESSVRIVNYVRPTWAIDTSKISGAAISRDTQFHYQIRSRCLLKFDEIYGSFRDRKWEFNEDNYGWDS